MKIEFSKINWTNKNNPSEYIHICSDDEVKGIHSISDCVAYDNAEDAYLDDMEDYLSEILFNKFSEYPISFDYDMDT